MPILISILSMSSFLIIGLILTEGSASLKVMAKFAIGVVTALLMVSIAGGAYYFGKKQVSTTGSVSASPVATTVTSTLVPSPSPQTTAQSTSDFLNPSATIAAIDELVPAKNYQDFGKYMTDKVVLGVYASGCCGTVSKAEAIKQLDYLNKADKWHFEANNKVAADLEAKNPDNFKDNVIGTSDNRYAVAFHLSGKFLIDKVFMVVDYKLITNP